MTWLSGPDPDLEPDSPDSPLPPDTPVHSDTPLPCASPGSPPPKRSRRLFGLIALGVLLLGGGGVALAAALTTGNEVDLASLSCRQLADRVVENSGDDEVAEAFRIRCGSTTAIGLTSTSEEGTITGSIAVGNEIASEYRTGYCSGSSISSGYSDIAEGTQAVVKDPAGKIIATGALESGTWKTGDIFVACVHSFKVSGIPRADFYTLSIGRRGEQTYSHADLQQRGWRIDLTLG